MLKKYINYFVIFITFFSFLITNTYAYEFISSSNESKVNSMIGDIYNSKYQYEDLAGSYIEEEIEIIESSSNAYWWPIGSKDVVDSNGVKFATGAPETTVISSYYGYRDDPFGGAQRKFHSGLDITGGSGEGNVNIIAVKDGTVVYPTADIKNDCPSSRSMDPCGGGYGNYIIIQHSDGNYSLYAHLYHKSITVKAGDTVSQGQVIAKMGSSGYSTGAHLHFEIREGSNSNQSRVDPLNYISAENPRENSSSSEFVEWLRSWEGRGRIEGNHYIVEDLSDGVYTVGSGMTLDHNSELFGNYGINVEEYMYHGAKLPIDIVDKVTAARLAQDKSSIEKSIATCSITLSEKQLEALVSNKYNVGNINGFCDAYKKYGNTEEFNKNWLLPSKLLVGTQFELGLKRRRAAEWSLFHEGVYVFNK